ncbi:hypothetical protein [Devosia sp. CAU 1758]
MVSIEKLSVTVKLGSVPEEGVLLLAGNELLALLVRLETSLYANDPEIAGKWSLEIGFGACAIRNETLLFDTLDDAVAWTVHRVSGRSRDVI